MTREEAITLFEKQLTAAQVVLDSGFGSNPGENDILYRRRKEMAEIALSALRPISRERVEKVWMGEWEFEQSEFTDAKYGSIRCSRCKKINAHGDDRVLKNYRKYNHFCPKCGAPMTNEAVGMMMKRLEAIFSARNDD
jgi:NADH pyrophosphatase NudC (nudix superfamily)